MPYVLFTAYGLLPDPNHYVMETQVDPVKETGRAARLLDNNARGRYFWVDTAESVRIISTKDRSVQKSTCMRETPKTLRDEKPKQVSDRH